jgi:hypothetical protein
VDLQKKFALSETGFFQRLRFSASILGKNPVSHKDFPDCKSSRLSKLVAVFVHR